MVEKFNLNPNTDPIDSPEEEKNPEMAEKHEKAVSELGSAFHEQWRSGRITEEASQLESKYNNALSAAENGAIGAAQAASQLFGELQSLRSTNRYYEPREKTTKDSAWIETHGTDKVDIANTSYDELPEDWKGENKAAAEVIVGILEREGGNVDLSDQATYDNIGSEIHEAWASRNEWQKDEVIKDGSGVSVLNDEGEEVKYGDPFTKLPRIEKEKDITQMRTAKKVFMLGESLEAA